MAFNGSGVFNRLYNWVQDRDNSIKILAQKMDDEQDGIATGLSTCITKDGQTTVTANIPMATNKFTGVGVGSANTDSVTLGQVQNGGMLYDATDTGAADAYAIQMAPTVTAYVAGQSFSFIAANASTGASTLNVDGLGTKAIEYQGAALTGAEIAAGATIVVKYDGTAFQMTSPSSLLGVGDMTAAVYDAASITEQLVGLTATQTLTNKQMTTIELGHASDTTLSRSAAGVLAVEGVAQAAVSGANAALEFIAIAASDETTDLTTGTAKATFHMPYAFTLTDVQAGVTTAPTGATLTVDINETGSTILSTKITIDIGEKTSQTAATPPVISDSALAAGALITIDIDQIGSTVAGTGLKVYLVGRQT